MATPDSQRNENLAAYKLGVEESIGGKKSIIYVDPTKLDSRPIPGAGSYRPPFNRDNGQAALAEQLNTQVPGAGTAAKESGLLKDASKFKNDGPAITSLVVNGKEHMVANLPDNRFDTKAGFIKELVGSPKLFDKQTLDAIIENTPGTDAQWMRYIGNHEGAHRDNKTFPATVGKTMSDEVRQKTEELNEEVRVDFKANRMAKERGEPEIALAAKDLRALSTSMTHATATPLTQIFQPVDPMHIIAGIDKVSDMAASVMRHYDKEKITEPSKAIEVLKRDPEGFFAAMNKDLNQQHDEVLKAHIADPTNLVTAHTLKNLEIKIDTQRDFEDAWRRRVQGQNVPERVPIVESRQAKIDAIKAQQPQTAHTSEAPAASKNYEQSPDGGALTTTVSNTPKGDLTLNPETWKMKTSDDASPSQVFAASAAPAPENVNIVPAFSPAPEATVANVQPAANEPIYKQISLG